MGYNETIFSLSWFIEHCVRITTKSGEISLLKLNDVQREIVEYVEENYGKKPIRMIILKARQMGITTIITAIGYWVASMHSNMRYGIVAHRAQSSESIYNKCRGYYNMIERELRPQVMKLSGEGIKFNREDGKGLNSEIMFSTVSEGVFRGETINMLHESERAYYEGDIRLIDASIKPCVPNNEKSIHIKESTANGMNYYKEEWDLACKGESDWKPFFFGWNKMKEYRRETPLDFKITEEERKLMIKFKLDEEQIAWRRDMIEHTFNGDIGLFMQEYPLTPTEAFKSSGGSIISDEIINKGISNIEEGKIVKLVCYPDSYIEYETKGATKRRRLKQERYYNILEDKYKWRDIEGVYEEIEYETPYVLSCDTSGSGLDNNVIYVLNGITGKTVAKYVTRRIDEHNLAMIINEIGRKYNEALVVVENNYSHAIYDYLKELGYKRLYYSERIDKITNEIINEYGFKTTSRSKPQIISNLIKCLDEGVIVNDKEFYEEAKHFVNLGGNKMGARNGRHDDHVMALAIALWAVFNSEQNHNKPRDLIEVDNKQPIIRRTNKGRRYHKGMYNNNA